MNVQPVLVTPARSMIVPVRIQGVSITRAVINAVSFKICDIKYVRILVRRRNYAINTVIITLIGLSPVKNDLKSAHQIVGSSERESFSGQQQSHKQIFVTVLCL